MLLLPLIASIALSTLTNAAPEDVVWLNHKSYPSDVSPFVQNHTISLPIDHFNNTDNRTFTNRYWTNSLYYKPNGPIFFYDFGEAGVPTSPSILQETVNTTTAPVALAKRFNGLIIGWEHRFYGSSLPFPLNPNTSLPYHPTEAYRYHTVEQALEDVVYFAQHFTNPVAAHETALHPVHTPWIWLGGSYPGQRGAFLRLRNPEVVYAVWASSATVQVCEDLGVYYNPIYRSMPSNCSADAHAVVQYVDGVLSSMQQEVKDVLKMKVFATQASLSSVDAVYNISDGMGLSEFEVGSILSRPVIADFQRLGPGETVQRFCDWMQSYNPGYLDEGDLKGYMRGVFENVGNNTPEEIGVVSRYGLKVGLEGYLYAARLAINASTSRDHGGGMNRADVISWQWQALTEIGNNMATQTGNEWNLVSRFVTVSELRSQQTEHLFEGVDKEVFGKKANVESVLRYGGWDMRPSNVMFTTGEWDPWRSLSVFSEEEGAPWRRAVTDVPQCGRPPSGKDAFGVVYPGAVHAQDLNKNLQRDHRKETPFDIGFEMFSRALEEWLPCFRPRDVSDGHVAAGSSKVADGSDDSQHNLAGRNA